MRGHFPKSRSPERVLVPRPRRRPHVVIGQLAHRSARAFFPVYAHTQIYAHIFAHIIVRMVVVGSGRGKTLSDGKSAEIRALLWPFAASCGSIGGGEGSQSATGLRTATALRPIAAVPNLSPASQKQSPG